MSQPPSSAPRVEIAIAVVRHAGRYLIGLRPDGAPLAGYWEFPGGKLQSGESPAQAAARECQEETGIEVHVVGEYPVATHDYDHAKLRLHFLACEMSVAESASSAADNSTLLPARFRWVPAAELSSYQFPPANAGVLAQLEPGNR